MGTLNKQVFKGFVDSSCERRLFLTLGRSDPRWISAPRDITPRPFEHKNEGIMELGKLYEAHVYNALTAKGGVQMRRSPDGEVVPTWLNRQRLLQYRDALVPGGLLCLLEHQFNVEEAFSRSVLGLAPGAALPILTPPKAMRPDLLVLDADVSRYKLELLPDGSVSALRSDDSRTVLRILDIKHTAEVRVGKSHFIELLCYAQAMVAFLEKHQLRDHFIVPCHGHGIFPQHELRDLFGMSLNQIDDYIVPMRWTDVAHLFTRVRDTIQKLYAQAPAAIDSIPVNIQPACGHCLFVEDCKKRLGFREGVPPEQWDVRLLPHTSNALAQQLNHEGFRTVGDVEANMAGYQHSDTPEPLYAEKPLLVLKARSLVKQAPLPATPENTGAHQHLTMAIPAFTDLELVFNAETDPTNDVVFAVGMSLTSSVVDGSACAGPHHRWWEAWASLIQTHRKAKDVDPNALIATLDPAFHAAVWDTDPARRRELLRRIRRFAESLWALKKSAGCEAVISTRQDVLEGTAQRAGFHCRFAYINNGADLQDERKLAEVLVERAWHLVVIASTVETLLGVERQGSSGKPYAIGPQFAGFYWSAEQLNHIQDLLERHLSALTHHPHLRQPLLELLNWLSPTESEVDPALQHKKLFNLRTYMETSIGLPHIINYTWHGLAAEAFGVRIDRRFWAAHFNYMDFSVWHAFVNERDSGEKQAKFAALLEQLQLKIRCVHRLLWRYKALGQATLSRSARPVSTTDLLKSAPPDSIHPLARIWYLFSRLNGTMQELSADRARTTFPARSIGRLEAGEVSDLVVQDRGRLRFRLRGLSANMKLRERNRVWLLPEDQRDLSSWELRAAQVEISRLRWLSSEGAYEVDATAIDRKGHPLHQGLMLLGTRPWYIFTSAGDIWSGRLYGQKESLFKRQDMGTSWLGRRLSFLWRLGSDKDVEQPASMTFGLPEIYLYAPEVLPRSPVQTAPLLTTASPPPDPSQHHAIQLALSSTISCLQGPPGTGKSQTIAALVDEFLCRRDGPARILVTAFSYAAMNVVLEKLLEHRDAAGQPTRAAQMQMVFLRSEGRDPLPLVQAGRAQDLVGSRTSLTLNGEKLSRRGQKRLEDYLEESFILFANAHQLFRLGQSNKSSDYYFLKDGFGFDLIIVDEASQMPADHFLPAAALVRSQSTTLAFREPPVWPAQSVEDLEGLGSVSQLDPDALTKVVVVGDHHQLPPVQAVKPPRKLRVALDSLFRYYADGLKVPSYQLRVNYRSEPPIVAYTARLGLYEGLTAFRADNPHPPLPPLPAGIKSGWLRDVLDPNQAVGAIIHDRQFETAVSPLEAHLTAEIAVGFFSQMGIADADAERHFWREHLGIVSPHNAHGRLVARRIFDALTIGTRRTSLDDEALMACLDSTVYSVEKFQGSDRTFILATIGVSSMDQLLAEEEFIYDLNRFNVLTSRAKQKMLLICSQNLLDYVPHDREVMANAARIRGYAMSFCDQEREISVVDDAGRQKTLQFRWHTTIGVPVHTPRPAPPPPSQPTPAEPAPSIFNVSDKEILTALGVGIRSQLTSTSPGVHRDEVIRVACLELGLSPLDDEARLIMGAFLEQLLAS